MLHANQAPLYWLGLIIGALLVLILSLSSGAYLLNWGNLLQFSLSELDQQIIWDIRLPRVLLAGGVGALLAVSGAALQGLFRNPLADPGLIGISSGAALAVAFSLVMLPGIGAYFGLYGLSLVAFAGGSLTAVIIFSLAGRGHNQMIQLILAGIAINAVVVAAVGFLTFLSDDQQLRALTFWTMGSFGGALWPAVGVTFGAGLPAVILLCLKSRDLNRLMLGEQDAGCLGTDVANLKRNIILLTSLAVGVSVAVSGIIGFIGLVVPHLVRLLWDARHEILIPASALLGAMLSMLADTMARTLVAPAEMPVGIITSLIGGPFFLWLLTRSRQTFN